MSHVISSPACSAVLSPSTSSPATPDPWLAVLLDETTSLSPEVKLAWSINARSFSRRILLPLLRPLLHVLLTVFHLSRFLLPKSWSLVRAIDVCGWVFERFFMLREVAWIAARHFFLSGEVAQFLVDNIEGVRMKIVPLVAHSPEEITAHKDGLIFSHQVRRLNLLRTIHQQLLESGGKVRLVEKPDFSAITDGPLPIEISKSRFTNFMDLELLAESVVLAGSFFVDPDTFFNNTTLEFQSDEIVGHHVATILGDSRHLLFLKDNRQALLPQPFYKAGANLFHHVYYTEVVHAAIVRHKREQTLRLSAGA